MTSGVNEAWKRRFRDRFFKGLDDYLATYCPSIGSDMPKMTKEQLLKMSNQKTVVFHFAHPNGDTITSELSYDYIMEKLEDEAFGAIEREDCSSHHPETNVCECGDRYEYYKLKAMELVK